MSEMVLVDGSQGKKVPERNSAVNGFLSTNSNDHVMVSITLKDRISSVSRNKGPEPWWGFSPSNSHPGTNIFCPDWAS